MDVEILSQRENPLLQRKEVKFRVVYAGAGSPGRQDVRNKLIAMLDAQKDLTILDYMKPEFGRQASRGYVKIYENALAMKVEPKHQLKRNFEVKEKKQAEAAAPAKAPEVKEKKPAEAAAPAKAPEVKEKKPAEAAAPAKAPEKKEEQK